MYKNLSTQSFPYRSLATSFLKYTVYLDVHVCRTSRTYCCCHVDRHERMRGKEEVSEPVGLLRSVCHMSIPGNEPAEAEVVSTLRSGHRERDQHKEGLVNNHPPNNSQQWGHHSSNRTLHQNTPSPLTQNTHASDSSLLHKLNPFSLSTTQWLIN